MRYNDPSCGDPDAADRGLVEVNRKQPRLVDGPADLGSDCAEAVKVKLAPP